MQMKMQKSGQHSSIGNQYYKEVDIDELFETKSCISSSVQQQVLSVGSVVLCILIFRAFKYTFYRVLPNNLRNIVTSAFGLATLYVFYAAEDIMLITPLLALFVSLKFLFPASSKKKVKKVSESENKIVDGQETDLLEPVKPEETKSEDPVEASVESVDRS